MENKSLQKKVRWTLLILLLLFILYQVMSIAFMPAEHSDRKASLSNPTKREGVPTAVQVDVLNGCGVSGVGQKATAFLRSRGYDVVEMRNYKTFDVAQTHVIDRSGNIAITQKIAADLGLPEKNVLQQISPEYFVTASVVIGKDFSTLKILH